MPEQPVEVGQPIQGPKELLDYIVEQIGSEDNKGSEFDINDTLRKLSYEYKDGGLTFLDPITGDESENDRVRVISLFKIKLAEEIFLWNQNGEISNETTKKLLELVNKGNYVGLRENVTKILKENQKPAKPENVTEILQDNQNSAEEVSKKVGFITRIVLGMKNFFDALSKKIGNLFNAFRSLWPSKKEKEGASLPVEIPPTQPEQPEPPDALRASLSPLSSDAEFASSTQQPGVTPPPPPPPSPQPAPPPAQTQLRQAESLLAEIEKGAKLKRVEPQQKQPAEEENPFKAALHARRRAIDVGGGGDEEEDRLEAEEKKASQEEAD
ncbi:MAG TPA: hypothetical protein DEA62_04305, partial [Coxiellaceae bacterium]|nr:hypothetical protein [Coxiellaceae bacterium]